MLSVDHISLSIFDPNEFELDILRELDFTDIDIGLIQNNISTYLVKE